MFSVLRRYISLKKKSRNADVANNKAIDFHISATLQANKCLG